MGVNRLGKGEAGEWVSSKAVNGLIAALDS